MRKAEDPEAGTRLGAELLESLAQELQGLGLPPYRARVLAALLRVGTANSSQLAEISGIPRTSTYQVLEALAEQGLAERLPSIGPAVWTCHGWQEVVETLEAAGEEQMRQYQARLGRLQKILVALAKASRSANT